MKRNKLLAAAIIATVIATNASAAQAFSWSWLWYGWSIITPNNIIAPNN